MRFSFLPVLILMSVKTTLSFAGVMNFCEKYDRRELSYDAKVARTYRPGGKGVCTAALIGKSCMISAGHCLSTISEVEFDVPMPNEKGEFPRNSINTYYALNSSIVFTHNKENGEDWAVFKTKRHNITGNYAGEERGFYQVELNTSPKIGDKISVTGFGIDKTRPSRNLVQQQDDGGITWTNSNKGWIYYNVHTTGGMSGGPIVNLKTNKIIGVHDSGGSCNDPDDETGNYGRAIAFYPKFKEAIEKCLAWEKKYL